MNQHPEKLTGTSLDISADNRKKLKQLFPTVFTEILNDKGEPVESIDFLKLKAELGAFTEVFENRRERYGMEWPGKKEALRLIQTPSAATLNRCREESVNFDATENLFIEGDNLEVLKLLQKSYYGKVKMIYIDPPYNTGKEFIYPDNFSESLETYLEYAGLIDGDGKKFSTNTANEGRFHTKWLNMMYPRLYLARNLLRDDGVIFISIDDNEVSNLRKLCDEILGEENFVANAVWQKAYVANMTAKFISNTHDHILIYCKNLTTLEFGRFERTQEQIEKFKNPDNDPNGPWKAENLSAGKYYSAGQFTITSRLGEKYFPPPGRYWRCNEATYSKWLSEGRIWFGEDGTGRPMLKKYLSEVKEGLTPDTWWQYKEFGGNKEASIQLKSLFDGQQTFDTSKPVKLLKRLLALINDERAIVLDFFAGSATTAHAVLDLNKQDNGNRKFILVQLPEPCAPESEAFKAGYKTIADIGKERIRRVIKKIEKERAEKEKAAASCLPGLGEKLEKLDLGFKVMKLDKSNFRPWQKLDPSTPVQEIEKQLEFHIFNIDEKATPEALLYEIIIKAGFIPTEKIEVFELKEGKLHPLELQTDESKRDKKSPEKRVFSVTDGELLLCLENKVTRELIDAVIAASPQQFICLDTAFHGNDQLKTNAVQAFNAHNMAQGKFNPATSKMETGDHKKIIFRTV